MAMLLTCLQVLLSTTDAPGVPKIEKSSAETIDGDAPVSTTDVLVYGSTPGGVMASVAAARHGANVLLLDPAPRVGGVCSGGLGRTDKGNPIVIGGLAGEFFLRNARVYNASATVPEYYLEPHVAEMVFLDMLRSEPVRIRHVVTNGSRVASVAVSQRAIHSITLEDGSTHSATVFIDATYEGDLMLRTPGVTSTFGRESRDEYNESYAGRRDPYSKMDWHPVSPYELDAVAGEATLLYPLVTEEYAAPLGSADDKVQGYNFRLCVTKNSTNMVPFPKPLNYNRSDWRLLFKYAAMWTKNGTVPDVLAHYLNSFGPVPNGKFDMNNGALFSTDCTGCQWGYPNASYEERDRIHAHHKSYQQGFLWTIAHDSAIAQSVRDELNEYGLCKDEFNNALNDHWPEQLYVREASRLVGDFVLTQNDVLDLHDYDAENRSIGMGSYNFDGHYSHRGPCVPNPIVKDRDPTYDCYGAGPDDKCPCVMLTKELEEKLKLTPAEKANSSIIWTGGEGYPGPNKGPPYQFPYEILLPKRLDISNLLCPLTPSTTHVALATVRMEPQFMIVGHAAGAAAALAAAASVAVQDVDLNELKAALVADHQTLRLSQPVGPHNFACRAERCIGIVKTSTPVYHNASCDAHCAPLGAREWLALKAHWVVDSSGGTMTAKFDTWLKKSELTSDALPADEKVKVNVGAVERLVAPPSAVDEDYWLVSLAASSTSAQCTTNTDCYLNGVCSSDKKSCVCYPGWTGAHCGQLDLLPTTRPGPLGGKAYPPEPNASCWGSSAIRGTDGKYHLYSSGILGNCGLAVWAANAALTHAVSDTLGGVYRAADVIMRGSNPEISEFNGELRLWHSLGGGPWGPETKGYCRSCTNGSTPTECRNETEAGQPIGAVPVPESAKLVVATDPAGPWRDVPITCVGWSGAGAADSSSSCPPTSNPTAYYYPNGTTLLMYDWQMKGVHSVGFFLASAPDVAGPYTPVSGQWNRTTVTWTRDLACTDPFLWRDPRGHFHAVFHCRDWFKGQGAGDAGGHAYSLDGVHWELAAEPCWSLTVEHTDGSNTTFFHRERPQLFIDPDTGDPAALFNAVSLANQNQPFAWQKARGCGSHPSHIRTGCDQSMAFVQRIRAAVKPMADVMRDGV
jgi:hypothetical protein